MATADATIVFTRMSGVPIAVESTFDSGVGATTKAVGCNIAFVPLVATVVELSGGVASADAAIVLTRVACDSPCGSDEEDTVLERSKRLVTNCSTELGFSFMLDGLSSGAVARKLFGRFPTSLWMFESTSGRNSMS